MDKLPMSLALGVGAVALLAAACGNDGGREPAPTPTATTAASTPTEAATTQPPPPSPTPGGEVTYPLHVVDLATGADGIQFVNAGGSFTWSPDGTRIAATTGAELGIANIETAEVQRWMLSVTGPKWSPDSRYLALAAPEALLVVAAETGDIVLTLDRETPEPVMGWTYDWAEDGKLAAASLGGPVRIWDGQTMRSIDAIAYQLWWLADGRLAALEARTETGPGQLTIRDGRTGYRPDSSIPAEGHLGGYAVSPSGQYAVEMRDEHWPDATVRVVEAGTGTEVSQIAAIPITPIERGMFEDASDAFLVHTNYCTGEDGLAIASPNGHITTLVEAFPFAAKFSPDGAQVAYTTATELWVVPATGGAPRLLAEGVHGPAGLAWSPDGTRIAYAPHFGGFGACD